jgi:hypothetical protein
MSVGENPECGTVGMQLPNPSDRIDRGSLNKSSRGSRLHLAEFTAAKRDTNRQYDCANAFLDESLSL